MLRALILCFVAFVSILGEVNGRASDDNGAEPGLELAFLQWTPSSGAVEFDGFERTSAGLTCHGFLLSPSDEKNLTATLTTGGHIALVSHQRYGDRSLKPRRAIVVVQRQIALLEASLPLPVSDTVIYVQMADTEAWLIDPDVSYDRKLVLRPSPDRRSLLFEVELEGGRHEGGTAWKLVTQAV